MIRNALLSGNGKPKVRRRTSRISRQVNSNSISFLPSAPLLGHPSLVVAVYGLSIRIDKWTEGAEEAAEGEEKVMGRISDEGGKEKEEV